jgi:hypothetical protein
MGGDQKPDDHDNHDNWGMTGRLERRANSQPLYALGPNNTRNLNRAAATDSYHRRLTEAQQVPPRQPLRSPTSVERTQLPLAQAWGFQGGCRVFP